MYVGMELALTNSVHDFKQMLNSFIASKKIVEEELTITDNIISVISDYKKSFARSNNIKSIEIVKIFSGLNLLQNFLRLSKKNLMQGVKKHENPKKAKEVCVFLDEIIDLANKIDSFKLNSAKNLASDINLQAIELREELRNNNLYPQISELERSRDKQSKKINELFTQKIIQEI